MIITGKTKLYFVAADPITQVRAPELFNPVFAACGVDAVLVPAHVTPQQLPAFVRSSLAMDNVGGLFLSIPHKSAAVELLDACDHHGRAAGAVNAIRRNADGKLEGALFDGIGLRAALDHYRIAYRGQRVLLVGAGGAAAAIAAALAEGGAGQIALFDLDTGKAERLAARIGEHFNALVRVAPSSDPAAFDLVLNATPLGLSGEDPLPFDVTRMAPGAALVDILMKNQPTPLLRAARVLGRRAEPGFEMLIQQAALYLDFFGEQAAAQAVRSDASALRRLIYPPELLADEAPAPSVRSPQ